MREVGLKYDQRTHVHVQYMYHIKIRNQKLGGDTLRCTDVEKKKKVLIMYRLILQKHSQQIRPPSLMEKNGLGSVNIRTFCLWDTLSQSGF